MSQEETGFPLLQEAFIQAPEPREARFIMDARAF